MADKKISDLPRAVSLTGPELFPGVQFGTNVAVTMAQVAQAALANLPTFPSFPAANMVEGTDEVMVVQGGVQRRASVTNLLAGVTTAPGSHTHALDDVTGLVAALAAKADGAATTAALVGKAATVHTHAIANVTGLQTALDEKAPNTALSGKADAGPVGGTGITMATARLLGRSTALTGAIEQIAVGAGLSLTAGTLSATGGGVASGPIGDSGLTQATARILGRTTGGSGAIEQITVGTGLALAGGQLSLGAHAHSEAEVTGLTAALAAKADAAAMTAALAAKAATGAVGSTGITMTTARLLGRTTAATGAVEQMTVGAGLSLAAGALTNSGVLSVGGAAGAVTSAQVAAMVDGLLYPAPGAMARTATEHAFRRRFAAPDGGIQLQVDAVPLATEYWRQGGAIAGAGPYMLAWSDAQDDVDAVIVAKGVGGVWLANGAGPALVARDTGLGLQVDAPVTVRGGATNYDTHPAIGAPFNRELWLEIADKSILRVSADAPNAGDTAFWRFSTDGTLVKQWADGSNANVSTYFQVKGTGQHGFGNAAGTFVSMLPPSSGAPANVVVLRPGPSGVGAEVGAFPVNDAPLLLSPFGRADAAGGVVRSGYVFRWSGTGFGNFTLLNTQSGVHFHDGATIAAAAVTLPAAPSAGQQIEISSTGAVTALTVTPNTGHSIVGAPTSLTAGQGFTLKFIGNSVNTWVRV